MSYMVEIDDRVHDAVVVSGDDLMACVDDAVAEWMELHGEGLTRRTHATMTAYVAGESRLRVRLEVESGDDHGADGEPLLWLVVGARQRADLEGL